MTTTHVLLVLSLSVSLVGCKKDDSATSKTPVEDTSKVVEDSKAPPETEPPVAEAEAEIPTAVDFEDEAIGQISDETLEKELSAIEEELGN